VHFLEQLLGVVNVNVARSCRCPVRPPCRRRRVTSRPRLLAPQDGTLLIWRSRSRTKTHRCLSSLHAMGRTSNQNWWNYRALDRDSRRCRVWSSRSLTLYAVADRGAAGRVGFGCHESRTIRSYCCGFLENFLCGN